MAILGALGDLVLALSADTAKFQSDLGRADRVAKKFGREVGRALGNVAGMLVALGGSVGLVSLIKGQIDAADAAGKMSQKIGISTEALSSYIVAARLADVSNEQLQTGFQQLSKNQADFVAGTGEAKVAFEALGITTQQVKALNGDTAALFELIAGKLASFEDGANKTALAMKIFGKSGAQLMPMINSLEQARNEAAMLGAVIDKDTAAAAERFNDNLTRVGISVQAVALNIAKTLLPTLEKLSEQMGATARDAQSLADVGRTADTALKLLATTGSVISTAFSIAGKSLAAFSAAMDLLKKGEFRAALVALQEGGVDVTKAFQDTKKSLDNLWSGLDPQLPMEYGITFAKTIAPALRDTAKEAKEAKERLKEMHAIMTTLVKIRGLGTDALEEALAVETDEVKIAELQAAALAKRISQEQELMDTLVKARGLGTDALEQMLSEEEGLAIAIDKNAEAARELGLVFSSASEDALVKWEGFGNFLKGLEQDLLRIATRKLVTEPLAEFGTNAIKQILGGGAGGGIGGFISGILSGGSAAGASPSVGQFAEGTDFVPRTGLAMVHKGEAVIPAEDNARGGRTSIIFNISTPDAGSFRSARGQIEGDMVAAMSRARRQS